MHALIQGRESSFSVSEGLFAGLIACILLSDILLVAVTPANGVAELLRLLLAAGAFGTVVVGVGLGAVRRPVYAFGSILAIPLVLVYAVTGLLLPWNQLSFYTGQLLLDALLGMPIIGERLATILLGGPVLSSRSLRLAFRYHYTIVSLALVGFLVVLGVGVYRRRSSV